MHGIATPSLSTSTESWPRVDLEATRRVAARVASRPRGLPPTVDVIILLFVLLLLLLLLPPILLPLPLVGGSRLSSLCRRLGPRLSRSQDSRSTFDHWFASEGLPEATRLDLDLFGRKLRRTRPFGCESNLKTNERSSSSSPSSLVTCSSARASDSDRRARSEKVKVKLLISPSGADRCHLLSRPADNFLT